MGIKISEMTPDSSVTGVELIPVSDAGSAKSVTTAVLKQYVIDAIEAISAGESVSGSDGVFVLQGGAIKPVDIDLVAQHAIDTVWSKALDASPADADILAMKSGSTEQTLALSALATYIRGKIEANILDVSDLTAVETLASDNMLLVTQGTTGKKVTLSALTASVLGSYLAYVAALSAVETPADSDYLYIVQSGVEKKIALSVLATYFPSASAVTKPETITDSNVPQWNGTDGALKNGKAVLGTVAAYGGAGTDLVTEAAVRAAIQAQDMTKIVSTKETMVGNDVVVVFDSEDSDAPKRATLTDIGTAIGAGLTLGETSLTAYRGDRGKTAYDHSQVAHAPADAQKNSDILISEIEAVLTGEINTHTHAGLADANDKGIYADGAALAAAIPAGSDGWYAIVVSTGTIWYWDSGAGPAAWVDSLESYQLELGETSITAYRGDRGKTAYDHSQTSHLALGETATDAYRGDLGKVAYDHSQSDHAPIGKVVGINNQTGTTYDLVLTDVGKYIRCSNAAAITVTVPANATVAFQSGTVITIEQAGAGVVSIAAAGGVTINAYNGSDTAGLYAAVQLIKIATDEWTLIGGVA